MALCLVHLKIVLKTLYIKTIINIRIEYEHHPVIGL